LTGPGLTAGELLENGILVDRDIMVDMYRGFERVIRFAGGLLYAAAKKAGAAMARRLAERGRVTRENALESIVYTFVAAGYAEEAVVESVEVREGETTVRLRVRGALLGSRLKSRKPVDQPIVGFIAGWLEALLGCRVDGREERCAAQGYEDCIFLFRVRCRAPELGAARGFRVTRSSALKALTLGGRGLGLGAG